MRTICDVCESAAAILFCASDEAVLCRSCDEKIHMCNKLASRHVRVGLADPSAVPCCDICENAPAYFYCEIDGSSLCLQCDMIVHVGGKRIHRRYLLFKMRVEFPGDKPGRFEEPALQQPDREFRREQYQAPKLIVRKDQHQQNHGISSVPVVNRNTDSDPQMENEMTDAGPHHRNRQALNNEDIDVPSANNNKSVSVVPVRPHESGLENEQETLLV